MERADPPLVALGVVAGAHGIAGEVRVTPFNPESENLARAKSVRLRDARGEVRVHRVVRSRRHKRYFLLKLEGIDDRDQADAARGLEVLLARDELEPLAEGEYYHQDLLGLSVELPDGTSLGVVAEIFETGASAVLVVRREEESRETLIPLSEDAVVAVEIAERRVRVRPDRGFLSRP